MFDPPAVEAVPMEGEAWSRFAPDGLLADMLSEACGGSCWDRLERIGGWERIIAWAQAAQVREIAGFARAAESDPLYGGDPRQLDASVSGEVGLMCRLSPRTADGRISDAVSLVERLPGTLAALSDGRISLPGARAVAEETVALDAQQARQAEDAVLGGAEGQTPSQIRAATRRVVARLDAEALRRRAAKARRERSVSLSPEPDGMASLAAYLPAPEAVAAYEVLDECARRAAGPEETRSMDARRADALVDLILDRPVSCPDPAIAVPAAATDPAATTPAAAPADPDPAGAGPSSSDLARSDPSGADPSRDQPTLPACFRAASRVGVQVRVTVSLTTLLGLDQLPGELAGYGPVPADLARELAAQGSWRRLVTDPLSGALLDYGTTRYRPPAHLTEHVITRAQTCGFPSCRMPAHRCALDHRVPFDPANAQGPTSDDNLDPHCTPHHLLKHSPGWSVTRHPDGTLIWHTPTGHTYHRHPPPVGEPDPPPPPPPAAAAPEPDDPPF